MAKWAIIGLVVAATVVGYSSLVSSELAFSGDRAFECLRKQVAFGPRPVGWAAHEKCRAYLGSELRRYVDKLYYQDFAWSNNGRKYRLTNIVGVLNPSAPKKILVGAHWDTRPTADMEPLPADRSRPIPGANDGASGASVVVELARALQANRPKVGVIFVLFDGEDYGPGIDCMFMGSEYYGAHPIPSKPSEAIVVDMVGDANLNIPKEPGSVSSDPKLVDAIWNTASGLGYYQFSPSTGPTVMDDHTSLENQGIPAIDIIDFEYPPWHTLQDTVDKCSPESLEVVGRTLEKYLRGLPG